MVVFPGSGPRHLDIAQLEKWWAGEWVLPAVFSTTHNLVKVHYGFCPVNFTCCFEGFAWEWWGSVLLTSGSTCNHQSWCLWVVDGGVPKGMLRWCWVLSVSPYRVYFYLFLIQTLQIMSTFHLQSILSESKAKDIWRRRC